MAHYVITANFGAIYDRAYDSLHRIIIKVINLIEGFFSVGTDACERNNNKKAPAWCVVLFVKTKE